MTRSRLELAVMLRRIAGAIVLLSVVIALLPDRASGAGNGSAGTQLADVTGRIDPALQAQLDQAAATYKQLTAADIATAVTNADKMLAALESNDLETARQAWAETRAAYERCKVLTFKFPYL